ncbi:hypothetical protein QZH41_013271, partial [Actinostola sp. cb2023]
MNSACFLSASYSYALFPMIILLVPAESYRGKYMLCFLDDGDGMDPDQVANVIKFGRSDKRIIDKNMIGQYGNGLKSGTMRIAKDMILFTKKDNKVSCLLISRTFHQRENIKEILIPMPNWDARTKRPLHRRHRDAEQHQTEVNIITKYSPFKTTESLFAEFDKIKSTGTLVVLYNMHLMDNTEPQLDVITDPYDILMADPYPGESYGDDNSVVPERKSFRAYTAILYLDPKMKVYIQNRKVRTVRLATSLYKPATYTFTSKRFKCRLEREERKAETELKTGTQHMYYLRQKLMNWTYKKGKKEKEQKERVKTPSRPVGDTDGIVCRQAEQRQAGVRLAEARAEVNIKRMILNNTKKALKDPQTLDFVFGIHLNRRRCCGIMVYNCNRLIKMYESVGCQTEGGVQGYGVMGVVNVPYLVLEPTHNKQDFADGKEYKALTKALGEHLDDYWKNCPIGKPIVSSVIYIERLFVFAKALALSFTAKQGAVKFWEAYGYNSAKWKDDPSREEKYVRKRMMDLPLYVQCDKCLKWRELAFHSRYVQHEPDEHWCCKMNPDSDGNNCQRPEKKPASISKAVLNKNKQQRTTTETNTPSSTPTLSRQAKQEKTTQQKVKTQITRLALVDVYRSNTCPVFHRVEGLTIQGDRKPTDSVKRRKSDVVSPAASEPEVDSNDENHDMDWTNEREAVANGSSKPTQSKGTESDILTLQGRTCEAKTDDGGWHTGVVVCLKQKEQGIRAKVKFREYQNDKYDKWYDYPGPSIRLRESSDSTVTPSSPVSQSSPQPLPSSSSIELPSTTTTEPSMYAGSASSPTSPVASPDNTVSSIGDREDTIQDLAALSRKLLEFFVPPNFDIAKEQLSSLSVQELRNFNA